MFTKESVKKRIYSYYFKILTYFMVISISCIFILGTLLSTFFFYKVNNFTSEYNELLLRNTKVEIENTLEYVISSAYQLGTSKLITKYLNNTNQIDYLEIWDIESMIINLVAANDYLDSIYVMYPDRNMVVTSYGVYAFDTFQDKTWIEKAKEKTDIFAWIGKHSVIKDTYYKTKNEVVSLVGKMPFYKYGTSGYILINIKEKFIADKLLSVHQQNAGHLIILDDHDELVSSTKTASDENFQFKYNSVINHDTEKKQGKIVKMGSEWSILNLSYSNINQWMYVVYTPMNQFLQGFIISIVIILLSIIAVVIMAIVIASQFSKKVYSPIAKLLYSTNSTEVNESKQEVEYLEFKQIDTNVKNILKEKDHLQQQVKSMIPSLREKFFLSLICGQILEEKHIVEYVHLLHIDNKKYTAYIVSMLCLDEYEKLLENFSSEERILFMIKIHQQIESLCEKQELFCCCVEKDFKTLSFIVGFAENNNAEADIVNICNNVLDYVHSNFSFTITIGVGCPVSELLSLSISCNQSLEVLEHRFIYGNNQVILFKNLGPTSIGTYINPLVYQKTLTTAIKTSNEEEVIHVLGEIKKIICANHYEIMLIRQFYLSVINIIFVVNLEISENQENASNDLNRLVGEIYKQDSLTKIHEVAVDVCINMCKLIDVQSSVKIKQTVTTVMNFLNDNYYKDISLDDVSSRVSYTPTYINKILKSSFQKTFYDILTDIRIEKAKELLINSDAQIYQIAELVGYVNVQSFIRMFKKIVAMTPGKYREMNNKDNYSGIV
jgi:two-component system, response regulator YesN